MLADGLYKASLLDGLRDLALGLFGPLQLGLNLLSRLKYGDWPSVYVRATILLTHKAIEEQHKEGTLGRIIDVATPSLI